MSELRRQIAEATKLIRSKTDLQPRVGIILGTGMGALANAVTKSVVLSYKDIPHFPVSTVETHAGNLHLGMLEGVPVMMMQGRFHYYEGYSMKQITFPVRIMKALGCTMMIVMNATGSMNPLIPRGSIVLAADHINLTGDNPLIGPNDDDLGPRFPDMSEPYSHELTALAEEVALDLGIRVHKGVMVAVTGPCLETAAEYRFFRRIGADIVTMSTVPEVIVANHAGLKVLGMSVVTDECLPDALKPADIGEIIATASAAEPRLTALVSGILKRLRA
ncbi:purine nucleoside phosphorylase [candidate division BRC1 bacterium SM23_51]|nr:MAG: purine nucleoside phosphorylase [candidate division BRC1 bacterium SM23_51]